MGKRAGSRERSTTWRACCAAGHARGRPILRLPGVDGRIRPVPALFPLQEDVVMPALDREHRRPTRRDPARSATKFARIDPEALTPATDLDGRLVENAGRGPDVAPVLSEEIDELGPEGSVLGRE